MSEIISGRELIEKNPHYKVFTANCQTFTIRFLEELYRTGHSVQNIKDMLENQTLERLKELLVKVFIKKKGKRD